MRGPFYKNAHWYVVTLVKNTINDIATWQVYIADNGTNDMRATLGTDVQMVGEELDFTHGQLRNRQPKGIVANKHIDGSDMNGLNKSNYQRIVLILNFFLGKELGDNFYGSIPDARMMNSES